MKKIVTPTFLQITNLRLQLREFFLSQFMMSGQDCSSDVIWAKGFGQSLKRLCQIPLRRFAKFLRSVFEKWSFGSAPLVPVLGRASWAQKLAHVEPWLLVAACCYHVTSKNRSGSLEKMSLQQMLALVKEDKPRSVLFLGSRITWRIDRPNVERLCFAKKNKGF